MGVNNPDRRIAESPEPSSISEKAQTYIEKVQNKIEKLVSDMADGNINRSQFKELYSHYQQEIQNIESLLHSASDDWQGSVTEGESVIIRKQHLARALAYAIYQNGSGLPLGTLGEFRLDPALVIPMLSSYRSATAEIFGGGARMTQIESGQWLCFTPGILSTLITVFSNEPVQKQLEFIDKLHKHFELVNRRPLMETPIDIDDLIYPHEYFLGKWQR